MSVESFEQVGDDFLMTNRCERQELQHAVHKFDEPTESMSQIVPFQPVTLPWKHCHQFPCPLAASGLWWRWGLCLRNYIGRDAHLNCITV